jgi:ABC-2 type transport system permease protein
MAANQNFLIEQSSGFRMGLRNMLQKENGEWWRTNRWWIQAIIWISIIVGMTASTLIGLPRFSAANGEPLDMTELILNSVQLLFSIGTVASAIGIIVLTQSEIIGEKQNGTAGWILSKPASRTAFYLSKLLSNGFSILILMIVLPLTLGYILFMTQKYPLDLSNYLIATGVMIVHAFFYLSLSLMLGVFSEKRGVVLAGTLGLLLGGQVLSGILKFLVYILPIGLTQIMPAIVIDGPAALPSALWIPVAVSFAWSLLFTGLSIWKIQRLEF